MSFRSSLLPILSILVASFFSFPLIAADNYSGQGMSTVILKDASDVPSAVTELSSELEKQGFTIPFTANHSAIAESVGLELAPNQVIFARPPRSYEKRLLLKSDTVGLDMPLKFLVYQEGNGDIKLTVNTLGYLLDRHEIGTRDLALRVRDALTSQFGAIEEEGYGLITVKSSQSVEDTAQTIQDALSSNPDVLIPLVLDYNNSSNKSEKQQSFPILIVFANPNVGVPLIQADPRMGIDLPVKFLIWKDGQEQVNITYNDPHFIANRVNLQGHDERLDAIANVFKKLASAGAGG